MAASPSLPAADLWHDTSRSPAANMAVDELLLATMPGAPALLRCYGWAEPATSIGYFQPATVAPAGYPFVRRPTGGGLVYHLHDFTFSLVIPRGHPLFTVDRFTSYRLVNDAVRAAMAGLGEETWLAPVADDVDDRRALVCFTSPARFDVIGPRGKLCGGAQRRTAGGMLHQASVDLDQVPDLPRATLAEAIAGALGPLLGSAYRPYQPDAAFLARVEALATSRYASDAWNRKR